MAADDQAIDNFLSPLAIPAEQILMLHVRLKGLRESDRLSPILGDCDYPTLVQLLLEGIKRQFKPVAVLVPAFTYGFTKTGVFDRTKTAGEVGRFGEEVRSTVSPELRSLDPVFSVLDLDGALTSPEGGYVTAFGPGSMLDELGLRTFVSVNINLPELVSTYLHYLEHRLSVPYRYSKTFSGLISTDGNVWEPIHYDYNVRRLDVDTRWRRKKIAAELINKGVLHQVEDGGVPMRWIHSNDLDTAMGELLSSDPYYLVTD
jgi:aminoglycoside N3'-acetyltransferase